MILAREGQAVYRERKIRFPKDHKSKRLICVIYVLCLSSTEFRAL